MAAQTEACDLVTVWADLHLHTVASACAEIEMIPPLIVWRAQALGLGLIAVTDHNTIDNVAAVRRAAEGTGLTVLPGMEVQTREEVHVVCIFDRLEQAEAWQDTVYQHLPSRRNRAEFFGVQIVVDHVAEVVRTNDRLLATSTGLSIEQVVAQVDALGGLTVAAHVDRPSYGILGNLGFVPVGLGLAALEVSRQTTPEKFRAQHPELVDWPLVCSGDAHRLDEMCAGTRFCIADTSCAELAMAFQGQDGRCIETWAK